jgi:hypothetical protein
MPVWRPNPDTSAAFTVAPEVALNLPIVLLPMFDTKICPRVVAGTAHSASSKAALRIEKAVAFWTVTIFITTPFGLAFNMGLVQFVFRTVVMRHG